MEKVTAEWASKIKRSFMSKFSTDMLVCTTIMKTLTYPTAALTVTKRECDRLMTKIKGAALPKMGMNRNIGHAYLYGPIRLQGYSFPNLFTELCIKRIKLLLKHGGRTTQIGTSLQACLEGHQLEIGIGTKIFDTNYDDYGFLASESIITHTWKILQANGLHLDTTHEVPTLYRSHDSFLMREIIRKTNYSKSKLKATNKCRLHLQVITVSNITEGNGLQVTADAFMVERDADRLSKWQWPIIPSPPKQSWDLWRGALETTYLRPDS